MVLHAKVVAALNLDLFSDAADAAEGDPALSLHRAYALYKLDRDADALAALDASPDADSDEALALRAQTLYKLGSYGAALDAFDALAARLAASDGEPSDLADARSNAAAAAVAGGAGAALLGRDDDFFGPLAAALVSGESGAPPTDAGYEALFNVAGAFLSEGDAHGAAAALEASIAAGVEAAEEDGVVEPSALAARVASARAQAALPLCAARFDEAARTLLLERGGAGSRGRRPRRAGGVGDGGAGADASTAAVALANLLPLKSNPRDIVDSFHRLSAFLDAANPLPPRRLLRSQALALSFHRAALLLRLGRPDEARVRSASLERALAAAQAAPAAGGGSASVAPVAAAAAELRAALDDATTRETASARAETAARAGAWTDAAAALEGGAAMTPHAAAAVAAAAAAAGDPTRGLSLLEKAAAAASGIAQQQGLTPLARARAAAAAATALETAGGFAFAALHDAAAAERAWIAVGNVAGVPASHAAAALACRAFERTTRADFQGAVADEARELVAQATALLGGHARQAGPPPSAADVDALEAGAAPAASSGAGSVSSAAAPGKTLAALAAEKARRHRRVLARRAKARAAYLASLAASDRAAGGAAQPPPDPERWLPKHLRAKLRRKRGTPASSGAQGASAVTTDAAAFDAREKARARAADAEAAAAAAVAAAAAKNKKSGGKK